MRRTSTFDAGIVIWIIMAIGSLYCLCLVFQGGMALQGLKPGDTFEWTYVVDPYTGATRTSKLTIKDSKNGYVFLEDGRMFKRDFFKWYFKMYHRVKK